MVALYFFFVRASFMNKVDKTTQKIMFSTLSSYSIHFNSAYSRIEMAFAFQASASLTLLFFFIGALLKEKIGLHKSIAINILNSSIKQNNYILYYCHM